MLALADAIRAVTARVQRELESGRRSLRIDAEDVIQMLLSIADEIDPPFGDPATPETDLPGDVP